MPRSTIDRSRVALIARLFAVVAPISLVATAAARAPAAAPPAPGASPSAPAPPTRPAPPAAPAKPSPGPAAPAAPAALPPGLVTTAPLPKAPPLGEVIKVAKVGERITFTARVAGRADPFLKGRAVMIVSDPSLKPCNEREDDHCPTPADLCCESPETLRRNTGTVQVVDAKGRTIPLTLLGVDGLAALDHLVVEGVLVERVEGGAFVVNASKVIRQAPAPAPK